MPESDTVGKVTTGPQVIEEGDCCEACGREIPIGKHVMLVDVTNQRIEEWCRRCAKDV